MTVLSVVGAYSLLPGDTCSHVGGDDYGDGHGYGDRNGDGLGDGDEEAWL